MNKQQFKALRSEYRNIERMAYKTAPNLEGFKVKLRKLESEFYAANPSAKVFGNFSKSNVRDQIVSMKVFRYLDYPFGKFSEQIWN